MKKVILIPDSFKGTLSARDFCAVAREAIGRADPGAQVLSIPLADGGIAYVLVQSASSARILFVDAGTGAVTAEGALENAWLPIFSASDEGLLALHYNPGVNDCTVISLRPDGQGGLSSLRGTVDVSDNACVGDDAVALIRYDEQGAPAIAIVSTTAGRAARRTPPTDRRPRSRFPTAP